MNNIQEQITKIENQLAGTLIPEAIKPALRKKLESLKAELDKPVETKPKEFYELAGDTYKSLNRYDAFEAVNDNKDVHAVKYDPSFSKIIDMEEVKSKQEMNGMFKEYSHFLLNLRDETISEKRDLEQALKDLKIGDVFSYGNEHGEGYVSILKEIYSENRWLIEKVEDAVLLKVNPKKFTWVQKAKKDEFLASPPAPKKKIIEVKKIVITRSENMIGENIEVKGFDKLQKKLTEIYKDHKSEEGNWQYSKTWIELHYADGSISEGKYYIGDSDFNPNHQLFTDYMNSEDGTNWDFVYVGNEAKSDIEHAKANIDTDVKTNQNTINTVEKFLNATGYNRGDNYPSKETLKAKMDELNVDEDTRIDVMSFLLYNDSDEDVSDISKPDITLSYNNRFDLNKAIETLIDYNLENNEDFTVEEKQFISKYSGYGGLQSETKKLGVREKGIMTEYYTPEKLIKVMYALAYKHGFENGGAILENSVGIGKFIKYAPKESNVDAFEISKYSYYITKILYPDVNIRMIPFENSFIDQSHQSVKGNVEQKYDLVIGNPPYGNFESKYSDTEKKYTGANNLTEYFITRSLDTLKPGGLLVYVIGVSVENGGIPFLDSKNNKCKQAIEQKADLVEAIRLGNDIFEGTSVLADVIVLKKK